jgi:hypothetical protein
VAGTTEKNGNTIRMTGLTNEVTEQLAALAADHGVGMSVEGVRRCSPVRAEEFAPGQLRFIAWLRKEHPEALAGGRFAGPWRWGWFSPGRGR